MPRVSLFMPLSRPEAASASPCMAASTFPGPYNCASTRFAQTQVGNFLALGRVVDSAILRGTETSAPAFMGR
jgi:hypothetical protein